MPGKPVLMKVAVVAEHRRYTHFAMHGTERRMTQPTYHPNGSEFTLTIIVERSPDGGFTFGDAEFTKLVNTGFNDLKGETAGGDQRGYGILDITVRGRWFSGQRPQAVSDPQG